MKAIRLHTRGGPEVLVYEEAPQPHPQAGEVLVRVHAAAVTPTELLWVPTWTTRTGAERLFSIILGHEFSGVIAALGAGVTDWVEGDPVYGLNDWFVDGAQAEYCVAPAAPLAPKPRSLDHLQAAVVPSGPERGDAGPSGPRRVLYRGSEPRATGRDFPPNRFRTAPGAPPGDVLTRAGPAGV